MRQGRSFASAISDNDDLVDEYSQDEKNAETFGVDFVTAALTPNIAAMSMEELEKQLFAKSTNINKPPPPGFVSASLPPPGLTSSKQQSATAKQRSAETGSSPSGISFSPSIIKDHFKGFMNKYDRELIVNLHIGQLRTESPIIEDFYCQALKRKQATQAAKQSGPTSTMSLLLSTQQQSVEKEALPLPRMTERARQRRAKATPGGLDLAELKNALGTISWASSKKPRQRMSVERLSSKSSSNVKQAKNVLALIEATYAAVIAAENEQMLREEHASLHKQHSLDHESILSERLCRDPAQLASVLGVTKGRRLVQKAIKFLPKQSRIALLANVAGCLPFLSFVAEASDAPDAAADHFITTVMPALLPILKGTTWLQLFALLESHYTDKVSESFCNWIIKTKTGLVFTCVLLSRCEQLKQQNVDDEDAHRFTEYIDAIYERLADHWNDFFAFYNAGASAPVVGTNKDLLSHTYYIWQLLAIIAMNVDDERKRAMVLDLRYNWSRHKDSLLCVVCFV